jgi:hypothetical protein
MKIKNEDGTINSLPIIGIFTTLAIALYILLFGIEIKEKIEEKANEIMPTTTTTTTTAYKSLCNDCTFNFRESSFDVSVNAEVDLLELLNLNRITINYLKFTTSDDSVATTSPKHTTYVLKTGMKEGSTKITASYDGKTTETTINVISPTNGTVGFKYDYYIIKKGKNITPELTTYPYGLNINNLDYCPTTQNGIFNCNKKTGALSGKNVGSAKYTISFGKSKASTTIYVVNNLITVKVNKDGSVKEARDITPVSNSFDIVIEFETGKDESYDNNNLSITFDSNPLGASVSFIAPDKGKNTYVYKVNLTEGTTGTSTMRVALPDGSFTLFNITK